MKDAEAQRFYNYLCMAYGQGPESLGDFVQAGGQQATGGSSTASREDLLPQGRAVRCPREYADFKLGYDTLIKPCLDRNSLRRS